MDVIKLDANLRQVRGKEGNKKLRQTGLVPAVLYKKGEESTSLQVDKKALAKALRTDAGENVILEINIADSKSKKGRNAIIKEIQKDFMRDDILHVDLQEISLTEKLKVKVPLTPKGEAIGVKKDGGVLQQVLWEIEVECLPTDIPEKIEIDISALNIGDFIHVKDITPSKELKIFGNPEDVVFSVEHPKAVEEIVQAPAEGTALEPELIREKKEKETPEGEEDTPKAKEEKKE